MAHVWWPGVGLAVPGPVVPADPESVDTPDGGRDVDPRMAPKETAGGDQLRAMTGFTTGRLWNGNTAAWQGSPRRMERGVLVERDGHRDRDW